MRPGASTGGGDCWKRDGRPGRAAQWPAALFAGAFLAVAPPMAAWGQAPPPVPRDLGGGAPAIVSPVPRVTPPPQPEVVPPAALPVQPAPVIPEGPPVRIDEVRVEGVTVYDPASLQPALRRSRRRYGAALAARRGRRSAADPLPGRRLHPDRWCAARSKPCAAAPSSCCARSRAISAKSSSTATSARPGTLAYDYPPAPDRDPAGAQRRSRTLSAAGPGHPRRYRRARSCAAPRTSPARSRWWRSSRASRSAPIPVRQPRLARGGPERNAAERRRPTRSPVSASSSRRSFSTPSTASRFTARSTARPFSAARGCV